MRLTPGYFENLNRRRRGKYARVGNVRMYYETYGAGKPLLMFHGGLSCIEGLRYQIPYFSKYFKVVLPEQPGHGRTADVPGDYTYEQMARRAASFMKALRIKKAPLIGYSDGANLIYQLAASWPGLVERFVSIGGNFHYSGCEPWSKRELKKQKVEEADPRYAAFSPDGAEHYPVVFEKCRKLWLTQPKWKVGLIRRIKAPGLIIAGDCDMIRHEHTLKLYRNLRRAQLAVIPGATHGLLKENPVLVNRMMLQFLKNPFSE